MSGPVDTNPNYWAVLKDCLLYWQEHFEGLSTTSSGRCTMLLLQFFRTDKANISDKSILESEVCKFSLTIAAKISTKSLFFYAHVLNSKEFYQSQII